LPVSVAEALEKDISVEVCGVMFFRLVLAELAHLIS